MTSFIISSKFPQGYGDLEILSSDNVVCCFPGHVLAHASSVFRDMRSTPQPPTNETGIHSVKITEPIMLLELFLTHIDSRMISPPINPETIESLITMADKYNAIQILEWFKVEADRSWSSAFNGITEEAFVKTHPEVVLQMAIRLPEFKELGRVAIRELSGSDMNVLFDPENPLNFTVLCEIHRLRQGRMKLFQTWVDYIRFNNGSRCYSCFSKMKKMAVEMTKAVHISPTWHSFETIYKSNTEDSSTCGAKDCGGPGFYTNWFGSSKDRALLEEAKLPDWPL